MKAHTPRASALVALALLAASCGRSDSTSDTPKASEASTAATIGATSGSAGSTASESTGAAGAATTAVAAPAALKTDVGVDDTSITLGVLTDQTGQFAAFSSTILAGNQIKLDEVNAAGGVCGRQIKLDIKDHGYNVENAKPRYDEVKDKVLGLLHVVGSPMNTKLLPDYEADHMTAGAVSWASSLLKNPYVVIIGPTYDVEMMNAYSYLVSDLGVKAGDKVGHIWQEGEYGQNGQLGARYAAGKLGIEYIDVPIKPTDTDLTTQVNDLLSKGVTAISITSGPKQSASVVTVLEQAGSPIPVISSNPGYNTSLVEGATGEAMAKHFYVAATAAPYTSDNGAVKKVVTQFEAKYTDVSKGFPVNFGYAQAALWVEALTRACTSGDMTRDGVHAAFGSITKFDTGGLVGVLDYSKPGAIPARESYIAKADPAVAGGLTVVKPEFVSDIGKDYVPAG